MLKPSAAATELKISKVEEIISFLKSVEKANNIKLFYKQKEGIKNAGKYRHSVNFEYVSIKAYDTYSVIINKEIENFIKSSYERLDNENNQRETFNRRIESAFGESAMDSTELFETLYVVFSKGKQVSFAHAIYILFKEVLTKNLLMKNIEAEEIKPEKKKKRFLFF